MPKSHQAAPPPGGPYTDASAVAAAAAPDTPPTPGRPPKPWEPQEGESIDAFTAAQHYFTLGAERSLAKVGQKCGKNTSLIERWSKEWRWVERARNYDLRMARIAQRAREAALARHTEQWVERQAAVREREWRTAEELQKLGEKLLTEELRLGRDEYKLSDVLAVLKRASELGRLATAMPLRLAAEPPSPCASQGKGDQPRELPSREV